MNNIKQKVYISGIGGIGVSAIAKLYLNKGSEVIGSDLVKSEITEKLESEGAKIFYTQEASQIKEDIDIFIYSPAVPADNPERLKVKELKITEKSYPEVLGELSHLYKTVAVSGTNGKSTTTAMLGTVMIDAQKDPTLIVGSKVDKIGGNFRYGESDCFLVEACEYRDHMMNIQPQAIILTNVELDHTDYFEDLNHVVATFQKFVDKLRDTDNLIVYNRDDFHTKEINLPKCQRVSYSINESADYMAANIEIIEGYQKFDVNFGNQSLGSFQISMPGIFNVYNALAVIAYCHHVGINENIIRDSLKKFKGLWRRFQIVNSKKDITVVSDYAHHPTAVHNTIRAAKEFHKGHRIIAVFQPHQHNRTKNLFNGFVNSFSEADVIVISEIFDVAGRVAKEDLDISSDQLVTEIKKMSPQKEVFYTHDLDETLNTVNSFIKKDDVVLVMGAGDIYTIAKKITL